MCINLHAIVNGIHEIQEEEKKKKETYKRVTNRKFLIPYTPCHTEPEQDTLLHSFLFISALTSNICSQEYTGRRQDD